MNEQTTEHAADIEAAADEKGFIISQFASGVMTVSGDGLGEEIDNEVLYTYSPYSGVEIGPSVIVATYALPTHPCYLCFAGTFEEQKAVFNRWHQMAMENERPAIYEAQGLKALVELGATSIPPYPELDIKETEYVNEEAKKIRAASRQLADEVAQTKELTEQDCVDVVEAMRQAASEQSKSSNA